MKTILFILFVLILFACHHDPPAETPGVNNTVHDTIVWIGQSARWKKTAAEIYDGSYDSVNSFFIPCGKTSTIKVSRNQIDFDLISNCDTSLSSRVKLFDLIRGDSFPTVLPHAVDPVTNDHFVNGSQTIMLRPAQQVRIQQSVVIRNEMYIRKQMIKKTN